MTNYARSTVLTAACFLLAAAAASSRSAADDWPTYRRDNARTAATAEELFAPLTLEWSFRSPAPPRSAWDEPARWDGYNKVYDLKNRQVFDKAFHVAAVGEDVFFGSSVDDQVYCLNAKTGEVRWRFFTEGPVRLAPTVVGSRVYVGSDDGRLYCLDRRDGSEIWSRRLGPTDARVPGNGRIVSLWPLRCGVVVVDDVAYAAAGVFPSEVVYVCALNAKTGAVQWTTELNDYPAQGYLLASPTRLYVTTGRNRPLLFDRITGERLLQVAGGGGGAFALLVGEEIVYGPGKVGEMAAFSLGDQIASFAGNQMIVSEGVAYLHGDDRLSRLERSRYLELAAERREVDSRRAELGRELRSAEGEAAEAARKLLAAAARKLEELAGGMRDTVAWDVPCDLPLSLILAGQNLVVGGFDAAAVVDAATGKEVYRMPVEGAAYGLAYAGGRLYVSTDAGVIHCFKSSGD